MTMSSLRSALSRWPDAQAVFDEEDRIRLVEGSRALDFTLRSISSAVMLNTATPPTKIDAPCMVPDVELVILILYVTERCPERCPGLGGGRSSASGGRNAGARAA